MGSSSSYLRLNILICGMNDRNSYIINKLFPQTNRETHELKREEKVDNLIYTARIFPSEENSNTLTAYINNNFDYFEIQKKSIAKNVVLYFSDENKTLQQNSNEWIRFANNIKNALPEVKLPFIIFLAYGEIDEIRNRVLKENGDIFGDFQDKRKIIILKLLRNQNKEKKTKNYRKILSYLWELSLILNQKPTNPSKNPEANLFRIKIEEPMSTIKILLTGFSRKGKSTFINMIFDKMVTLENPSFIPVTSEIIEFLFQSHPNGNRMNKGGLKLYDVPGLIEGTTDNMNNIQKLIRQSIEKEKLSHDVINYILFFLSTSPNFDKTSDFLRILNESRIKVIFIINRDKPRNNGMPNTTKTTLIAHLRARGFNNLIKGNGNNILEVDLINGVEGRTNEIFRYIYNDLTHNNRLDENRINEINNLQNQELFTYLHNNCELFSKISSEDDLIERGNKKANLIIGGTIPLMIATGFSPIPLIDIPIYLFLMTVMLINIFKAYGFNVNIRYLRDFFKIYIREIPNHPNNNNKENNHIHQLENRVFGGLAQLYGNVNSENYRFIIRNLIKVFLVRIGISAFLGLFDLIPIVGFIIGGVINAIMNSPFIKNLGNEAKTFSARQIRKTGGRLSILNIIQGYRESFSLLEGLCNKNDWTRKIQILDLIDDN